VFAATWNSTWAFPWPDAGETREIQLTAADVVHAHSGDVETETVPVPPLEPIEVEAGDTARAHFEGEGPTVIDDVEPQPAAVAASDSVTPRTRKKGTGPFFSRGRLDQDPAVTIGLFYGP
jgi:hypothetical protein